MKVLVADDENLIRESMTRVFQRRGHIVENAADGQIALEKWKSFQPDLVVLDILMPQKTGIEVVREMAGLHNAKVVLMSAFAGHEDLKDLEKLGVKFFIQKPFNDIFQVVSKMESLTE